MQRVGEIFVGQAAVWPGRRVRLERVLVEALVGLDEVLPGLGVDGRGFEPNDVGRDEASAEQEGEGEGGQDERKRPRASAGDKRAS